MEKLLQEFLTEVKYLIQTEIGVVKEELSGLREDVKGLKEDVSELKQEVAVLKEDVSELKTKVYVLEHDMVHVKPTMATKQDIELLHGKLDIIYAQVACNKKHEAEITDIVYRVQKLETDVRLIKKIVAS